MNFRFYKHNYSVKESCCCILLLKTKNTKGVTFRTDTYCSNRWLYHVQKSDLSIYLSMHFFYLSIYLSIYLSMFPFIYICVSFYLYINLFCSVNKNNLIHSYLIYFVNVSLSLSPSIPPLSLFLYIYLYILF